MIDYHVHSQRSGDSDASMTGICSAAIEKGITELCLTEHVDFEPTDSCYGAFDYLQYCEEYERARDEFDGQLDLRFGVEIDYQPKYHSQIRDFFDDKEFDYAIGAAHYVDGIILEDHDRYFPGKSERDAYEPYFENVLAAVETGWFDTIAHLDLCKRYGVRYYGPFNAEDYADQIETILRAVIGRKLTLEVNTSGLRQSPKEAYPCDEILRSFHNLGGRSIIVGSDAHRVKDVGAGIAETLTALSNLGFEGIDTYRGRRRIPKKL